MASFTRSENVTSLLRAGMSLQGGYLAGWHKSSNTEHQKVKQNEMQKAKQIKLQK